MGGAIYTSGNTVFTFIGTNNFISNHVNIGDGGAIYTLDHVVFTFNGTNNFINYSAGFRDGAICARNKIFNGLTTSSTTQQKSVVVLSAHWIVLYLP